ncbi:MAG TPA: histidine phosphatase family protein [Solirubrobacteraceae bacterium]|jgi:broad specificity phosphatase PhoE|nr:histidine phosphatase family protein [Solirubrobacteraceae bacterium]
MAAPPRVYLARHGQTAYNKEGRFQGQLPVPLDETGRAQARELAEQAVAHEFAALWCSPLLRARETADAVAKRIGLEPREDARLMETDAGDWTDRLFSEIHAEAPEEFAKFIAGDPFFAFPGGESFAQQGVRVAAAIYDVRRAEAPALVVCHGGVIRLALALHLEHGATLADRVPNGALIPLDPREARRIEHGGDPLATTPG